MRFPRFCHEPVSQIRNLLLYVLAAIIILGLLRAFILAYHNFVPLRNVIRLLADKSSDPIKTTGSPASISQAVARLIDHDKNLQIAVER